MHGYGDLAMGLTIRLDITEYCIASTCQYDDLSTDRRTIPKSTKADRASHVSMLCRLQQIHLGSFPTEEAAARAFDAEAVRLRGPDTYTNFPVPTQIHQVAVPEEEPAQPSRYIALYHCTAGGMFVLHHPFCDVCAHFPASRLYS